MRRPSVHIPRMQRSSVGVLLNTFYRDPSLSCRAFAGSFVPLYLAAHLRDRSPDAALTDLPVPDRGHDERTDQR